MDASQYADLFLTESREHLSTVNQRLLEWERDPSNREPIADIFRAMHTLKGMAHTMGYTAVGDLAHKAESLLDLLRKGAKPVTDSTLEVLFRATDTLEHAIEASVEGRTPGKEVAKVSRQLDKAASTEPPAPKRTAKRARPRGRPAEPADGGGMRVRIVVSPDAALKGARALVILRRLEAVGRVLAVKPARSAFESDDFDGRLTVMLETDAGHDVIEAEIRAAGDVAQVKIDAGDAGASRLEASGGRARNIRVDLRRLDSLMNSIGELVTERERLAELAGRLEIQELEDAVVRLSQLSRNLQAEIIEARMTPVWQVFDRFPRLVRDIAVRLGKQVVFQVEGKDIELDRAILDEIGDPLVHLLRNAIDHGIEDPETRIAAGKPAEGRIVLTALRERAAVVIIVSDDGRGIDRAKVLAEARERGLVGEDEWVSDDVVLRILARPGFTTADSVSDMSGRGVGIDVVATRLRALGGSVEVQSDVGNGTTFTLRVPPTLAIVPALLARVGEEEYALPLAHVAETVAYREDAVSRVDGAEALRFRDHVVPLVHLRQVLDVPGKSATPGPVVILEVGERRTGVVVDAMLGQQEIVVRPFDPPKGTLPVFTGASILGHGRPVLILDAGGLV